MKPEELAESVEVIKFSLAAWENDNIGVTLDEFKRNFGERVKS